MSVNQFLPRPIRLYQAFNSDTSSGGPPSTEFTRRSFLKRTGGATIATLVAWNMATRQAEAMANAFSDGISTRDFTTHIIICTKEPAVDEVLGACNTKRSIPLASLTFQPWRGIPNIEISDYVKGCDANKTPIALTDMGSSGYTFFLLHWITLDGKMIRKGDYITACRKGGILESRITPHAAIIQGKYYLANGVRKWGYTTLLNIAAKQPVSGSVVADGLCPHEQALVLRDEKSSGYNRLDVSGQVTGWLHVSGAFYPEQGSVEGKGTSVVQRWFSCAAFVPKLSLETISDTWSSDISIAGSYAAETTLSPTKQSGGINVGWKGSSQIQKLLKVNSAPTAISHSLSWLHQLSSGELSLTPEVQWPALEASEMYLPHEW